MSTQVILLERVESLGNMGDVVSVKPGYARNYLLPQKKALRASKDNVAYFEAQKKTLQAENDKLKKEAEKLAKKIEGTKVPLIRQASESGQLFGSVTARDIAAEMSKVSGEKIDRTMVKMNQNYKLIGLFPVNVTVHPEVVCEIIINIARSSEEAKIQADTGRALIAETQQDKIAKAASADENEDMALQDVLESSALEAKKEQKEEAKLREAKDQSKDQERSEKRAAKKSTKAAKKTEDAAPAEEEIFNEPEDD